MNRYDVIDQTILYTYKLTRLARTALPYIQRADRAFDTWVNDELPELLYTFYLATCAAITGIIMLVLWAIATLLNTTQISGCFLPEAEVIEDYSDVEVFLTALFADHEPTHVSDIVPDPWGDDDEPIHLDTIDASPMYWDDFMSGAFGAQQQQQQQPIALLAPAKRGRKRTPAEHVTVIHN